MQKDFRRRLIAFNKYNPSELLNQLLAVLGDSAKKSEGAARKRLIDVRSRVKSLTSEVQAAWDLRHDV